jgi:hypothetical protein
MAGSNLDFTIFPNPASDWVKIRIENPLEKVKNGTIEIFDVQGLKVYASSQEIPGTFEKQIATIGFPEGEYLVSLKIGGEAVTKKISVVR